MTRTVSPLWTFIYSTSGASETIFMNFFSRSSRADRAEDAGAARVIVVLDDHRGVLVELDVAAVRPATLLTVRTTTALTTSPRLTLPPGSRPDGRDDDVADAGVAPRRAAEHPDAQDLLGAGVVGNLEPRFLLNHQISLGCAREKLLH